MTTATLERATEAQATPQRLVYAGVQDEEPTGREEDDILTVDYTTWTQGGRLWLETPGCSDAADESETCRLLQERMARDGYWPNLWYIGERGDENLLTIVPA